LKYNNFIIAVVCLVLFGLVVFTSLFGKSEIEYDFYDLDGNSVKFDKYKEKYSILTFTFTSCPTICPMINIELNKLSKLYGDKINIVSINVDPQNDTPDNIVKFMKSYNYDWDILVGKRDEIEKVMKSMLHSDRKLEMPGYHLPNLHLMDKNFDYIQGFYPVFEDMNELIAKLDELIGKMNE
tara:strand:+ start:118 stop:663 length:546 start_codon:yes stop_codon:yes gene_type:complete